MPSINILLPDMIQKILFACWIFQICWYCHLCRYFYHRLSYKYKINGIKIGNGQEIIYYDANWKKINTKSGASYYRVVNFKIGTLDGPVKGYYISGKVQSIGNYDNINLDYVAYNPVGEFIYYYESGKIEGKTNYSNHKANGIATLWWENGNKKEEVTYKNGEKDGCEYTWSEIGKPQSGKYYQSKLKWEIR